MPDEIAEIADDIVEAITKCLARNGFDRTSLEEIATEAGTSRATLYRRFGGRTALFEAFLAHHAKPIRQRCVEILSGPGSVEERLEEVLVALVRDMENHEWLRIELERGVPSVLRNLLRSVNTIMGDTILLPLLEDRLNAEGELEGFSLKFVSDWVVQQLIVLVADEAFDDEQLRRFLRLFIMRPLLSARPASSSAGGLVELKGSLESSLRIVHGLMADK